ncbi:hypothetical protein U1Q18_025477 [Sarracenia purpurea var. burkii]
MKALSHCADSSEKDSSGEEEFSQDEEHEEEDDDTLELEATLCEKALVEDKINRIKERQDQKASKGVGHGTRIPAVKAIAEPAPASLRVGAKCDLCKAFGHATVKCAKAQLVDTQQVWTTVNKGNGKWEDRRNMHDAPSTSTDPSVSNPSTPATEFLAVAPTSNSFTSLAEDSD